jgi:glycosyltransferase involved in cell wall biosynthesis
MGGMERMVCDLTAGLAANGVPSVLFCTDAEGALYDAAHADAKMCGTRKAGLFVIDWSLVAKLKRFVREQRVTLLHAHNHAPTLYCVLVSLLTGIPVVVTRHGQGYKTLRWKLLTRLLALRAKQVVLVSEDSKRVAMANHSVPERKAIVIHNGIDIRRFAPEESGVRSQKSEGNSQTTEHSDIQQPFTELREKLGIPANAVVIGSVGRLVSDKNYPLLIRAFARVVVTRPECYIILVGDGSGRRGVESEIDRLNVKDRCHITGMVSDVRPWLGAMDVFCLSSDTEGLSISLLEAGACGLPSVVTDVGGNREVVVDGQTGIVVPKGDEQALAGALERLINDAGLRRQMGAQARKRIEKHFSLKAMVEEYEKIYRNVRGRGRGGWRNEL